jgi:hypothetical protein
VQPEERKQQPQKAEAKDVDVAQFTILEREKPVAVPQPPQPSFVAPPPPSVPKYAPFNPHGFMPVPVQHYPFVYQAAPAAQHPVSSNMYPYDAFQQQNRNNK